MTDDRVKPPCKLNETDGNIFALGGRAGAALKRAGQYAQAAEMYQRMSAAPSYEAAIQIIMEYVEVS